MKIYGSNSVEQGQRDAIHRMIKLVGLLQGDVKAGYGLINDVRADLSLLREKIGIILEEEK